MESEPSDSEATLPGSKHDGFDPEPKAKSKPKGKGKSKGNGKGKGKGKPTANTATPKTQKHTKK